MDQPSRDDLPAVPQCGDHPPSDTRADLRRVYAEQAAGTPATGCGCFPPAARSGAGSLGCGDPVALAELEPGQAVLDLGCGAGGDCFVAAERVGGSGHVIGVDMTPAMIETARASRARLGTANVEFRLGEIEHLPVADASVDVVISNCVIALSPDRAQAFREAYRVLKPGGRLALSDVMTDGPVPQALRASLGDAARTLVEEAQYLADVRAAGFVEISLSRRYPDPDPKLVEEQRQRLAGGGAGGRFAVVRIAETGEERMVRLDATGQGPVSLRSFSGGLRARKPA